MTYRRIEDELHVINHPICIHFRSKAMFVSGQMQVNDPANVEKHAQSCWCNSTQHAVGPDRISVSPKDCSPERSCYVKPL